MFAISLQIFVLEGIIYAECELHGGISRLVQADTQHPTQHQGFFLGIFVSSYQLQLQTLESFYKV